MIEAPAEDPLMTPPAPQQREQLPVGPGVQVRVGQAPLPAPAEKHTLRPSKRSDEFVGVGYLGVVRVQDGDVGCAGFPERSLAPPVLVVLGAPPAVGIATRGASRPPASAMIRSTISLSPSPPPTITSDPRAGPTRGLSAGGGPCAAVGAAASSTAAATKATLSVIGSSPLRNSSSVPFDRFAGQRAAAFRLLHSFCWIATRLATAQFAPLLAAATGAIKLFSHGRF